MAAAPYLPEEVVVAAIRADRPPLPPLHRTSPRLPVGVADVRTEAIFITNGKKRPRDLGPIFSYTEIIEQSPISVCLVKKHSGISHHRAEISGNIP